MSTWRDEYLARVRALHAESTRERRATKHSRGKQMYDALDEDKTLEELRQELVVWKSQLETFDTSFERQAHRGRIERLQALIAKKEAERRR